MFRDDNPVVRHDARVAFENPRNISLLSVYG
jgi:hypothetical protein